MAVPAPGNAGLYPSDGAAPPTAWTIGVLAFRVLHFVSKTKKLSRFFCVGNEMKNPCSGIVLIVWDLGSIGFSLFNSECSFETNYEKWLR